MQQCGPRAAVWPPAVATLVFVDARQLGEVAGLRITYLRESLAVLFTLAIIKGNEIDVKRWLR